MLNDRRFLNVVRALALGVAVLAATGCPKKSSGTSGGGGNAPAPAPSVTPSPSSPAPAPSPSPVGGTSFAIYNDAGGVLGDPNVLLFTGGGLTITEETGGAPEGTKFLRSPNAAAGGFWGVTMDKNNTGHSQNLSAFSGGALKFQIRVNRATDVGDRLLINLTDANNVTKTVQLALAYGFNPTTVNAWQPVSIPISTFPGLDLSKIKVPFALAIDAAGTPITIDIDDVKWQ